MRDSTKTKLERTRQLLLWFCVSLVAFSAASFFLINNPESGRTRDLDNLLVDIIIGVVCAVFFTAFVREMNWHNGVDYIIRGIAFPFKLLFAAPSALVGWSEASGRKRAARHRAKAESIRSEADVLDARVERESAKGRLDDKDIIVGTEHVYRKIDLKRARNIEAHGEQPSEEMLRAALMQQQLEHQERMNQHELESVQRSRNKPNRHLPSPKDDDDDGVVF